MNVKQLFSCIAIGAVIASIGCSKENEAGGGNQASLDTLRGQITQSRTLEAGRTYYIDGPTFVKNSAVLTIRPGVIIKAIANTRATLVITRGSRLVAEGTQNAPIVFTTNLPVAQRRPGLWGGIVLLGRASVNSSFAGVANQRQVEGFTSDESAAFGADVVGGGGTTPNENDNSGILKYVRIEFAGIALSNAPNSELNSLTMIGCGKQTVLDYVQCSFGGDDSFEWFGGNNDAKHLVAYRGLDDDFDTDNGYTGRIQFAVSIRDKDIDDKGLPGTSNGFESDNDAGASGNTPLTAPTFSNVSLIGPWAINNGADIPAGNVFGRGAHIRLNSRLSLFNSVVVGWRSAGIFLDGAATVGAAQTNDLEIRNTYIGFTAAGRRLNATTVTGFNAAEWFMAAERRNDTTVATVADFRFARISGLTSLTNIDVRPTAGSPLLGKTDLFTHPKVNNDFFTRVNYIGAFAENDNWLQGWTNFDPVNAAY